MIAFVLAAVLFLSLGYWLFRSFLSESAQLATVKDN